MSRNFSLSDVRNSKVASNNSHLFPEEFERMPGCNKFFAKNVVIDGVSFQSKKECGRYLELKMMHAANIIKDLKLQKEFVLIKKSKGERKCIYKADFVYTLVDTGETVVEDVKSAATRKLATYIIKRKLMLSVHGIAIKEV